MPHAAKQKVATLSVVCTSSLMMMKIVAGLAIGSVAVLSEAIHSGVDLVAALIALTAVRKSAQPADESHPFGHGKMENLSGAIEALLIFAAAAWIIYESIEKLIHPTAILQPAFGVGIMLISSVFNFIVSRQLFKVGRATDSQALLADGWHLRTDVYTSLGVMIGLAFIWAGETAFVGRHFHWIDPVVAILVALLIIKTAYQLTIQAGKDLLDTQLPKEEVEAVQVIIKKYFPQVRGFHFLRTRKSGAERFVDFHIMVDPSMTVQASHDITDRIYADIRKLFPQTRILAHVEPCDGECAPVCLGGCLLLEIDRKKIQKL